MSKAAELPVRSEDEEQRTVMSYLQARRITAFHIPNGGSRNVIEAAKLKGLGVRAGVPDICIADKPPLLPDARGVWIEMKRRKGGQLSDHQRWWVEHLQDEGHLVRVCKGSGEAIDFLRELGW